MIPEPATSGGVARRFDSDIRLLALQLLSKLAGLPEYDIPTRSSAPDPPAEEIFAFGSFAIDRRYRTVTGNSGEITLTFKEFELLLALALRSGAPVSKRLLRAEVWKNALGTESRSIDQHIAEVRRKLRTGGSWEPVIRTVRKVGYSLNGSWRHR